VYIVQALAPPPQNTVETKDRKIRLPCICVVQWCQFRVSLLFLCSKDDKGQHRFIPLTKYWFRLIVTLFFYAPWMERNNSRFIYLIKHWCRLRVTFLFLCLLDGTGQQPIRFISNQTLVSTEFKTSFSLLTG
jgi:hypothetical protein